MNRLIVSIALLLAGSSSNLFAQSYHKVFANLISKKDTTAQITLLKKWNNANSNDPELYCAYFNYYIIKSQREVLSLNTDQHGQQSLKLTDTASKTAGFLNSDILFDSKSLALGLKYIEKGISKFPSRLDMRFGKIFILGKTENYQEFTNEIIKTLVHSNLIKNKWIWTEGKPVEDGKNYMLSTVQQYIYQLYNTRNDTLLPDIQNISATVLKYYPDNVESLSNVSVIYILKKEYDNALVGLLKAEKLAPEDPVILGNIGQVYKKKKDKMNAIKYYELVLKYGDEREKEYAKSQIEELKKSN